MNRLSALLPDDPRLYLGERWVVAFSLLFTILMTARSLIHICRADGGAASIAGIDIEVEGGRNIVAIFAQWGVVQLLLATVAWIGLLRYRGLIPLVLLLNLLENLGRIYVGRTKPLQVEKPPPGARGSIIFVPLLAIALWHSLRANGDK